MTAHVMCHRTAGSKLGRASRPHCGEVQTFETLEDAQFEADRLSSGVVDFFYPNGLLVFLSYLFVAFAFFATTFLIFFLTTMYLPSFWSLIVLGVVPVLSAARWILPIKDLPVRSIGVMAGVILFVSLSLGGLVHGPSILSMFTFVMKNFIFH
jgi:hypothetical protein